MARRRRLRRRADARAAGRWCRTRSPFSPSASRVRQKVSRGASTRHAGVRAPREVKMELGILAKPAAVALLLSLSLAAAPLVNLNVAAVDAGGQPVPGLRAEDFQVLDNGKPRKIVMLRPVHRNDSPATFILLDLFNADLAARGLSANEIVHTLEKLESADNVYLYLLTSTAKIFAIHSVAPYGVQQEVSDGPWTRRIKPMLDEALRQVTALKSGDDQYPQLRIGPTWKAL